MSENNSVNSTVVERGGRYGKFKDQAFISQRLKDCMQATVGFHNLQPDQKEALEMIQHKVARILNGDPDYADSWHDIAGYATLIDKRLNGEVV